MALGRRTLAARAPRTESDPPRDVALAQRSRCRQATARRGAPVRYPRRRGSRWRPPAARLPGRGGDAMSDAILALRAAIHARLEGDAALTALVGPGRIHDEAPRA